MKTDFVDVVIAEAQALLAASNCADKVVILRSSDLARLIVQARTQGYERGKADALVELAREALPAC